MGGVFSFIMCLMFFCPEPHSRRSFCVCHQSKAGYMCRKKELMLHRCCWDKNPGCEQILVLAGIIVFLLFVSLNLSLFMFFVYSNTDIIEFLSLFIFQDEELGSLLM